MQEPKVIFESDNLLILNKPANLVVHGDGRTQESTLVDWLLREYPGIKDVGESWHREDGREILRPGIVHRLDRETSGVMVVAKTQESFEDLKKQFKDRSVYKEYRAIITGNFKEGETTGIIDKPIGKSPSDFRKWSAQPGARGTMREAITEYKVIESVGVGNNGLAYIGVTPKTGRTHQIRVHLKAIHHSILGDKLYGVRGASGYGVDIPRTMLHACLLEFTNLQGERVRYAAELPGDFLSVLGRVFKGRIS